MRPTSYPQGGQFAIIGQMDHSEDELKGTLRTAMRALEAAKASILQGCP